MTLALLAPRSNQLSYYGSPPFEGQRVVPV